jgi:hypothetical protein
VNDKDTLSIFSTDSGRVQKEEVKNGALPVILEKMKLPPVVPSLE